MVIPEHFLEKQLAVSMHLTQLFAVNMYDVGKQTQKMQK